ncbi:MAG: erythromycin esterase family protein, partial [Chloroflexi bacterium]|nr:erythromycin esterase family protein [Chloroflexota bacterium]
GFLQQKYPELVPAARRAYKCFEPYTTSPEEYARLTALVPESCESEVVKLLARIRQNVQPFPDDDESAFSAEMNALVAVNAERYYRAMIHGGTKTWNIRDMHMMETLDRLMQLHGPQARGIVWAHNSHVGDARATDMANEGMINIGQLAREQHREDDVVLVGFSSHHGTVIAGSEWGAPMQTMDVPPAKEHSWEDIMHQGRLHDKLVILNNVHSAEAFQERDHRAIGVVYDPSREGLENYVPTVLPERYDALLHLDETHALHPLHVTPVRTAPPDTYPWGL